MHVSIPADIGELQAQLEAADRDARVLVTGLSEDQGTWQARAGSWSVAECLDHLATANRVYLDAMQEPAARARQRGRHRRRPLRAGWAGRMFVKMLEPPPARWPPQKAPAKIQPRPSPPLADALGAFLASHADVVLFLQANADLDLTGIRFPNPLARGVYFSLATGLLVIAAHERRHLWQAWNVRRACEARSS